uniref:Protein-lysine N-methyltransferase EFM4 n=1 Tax=Coccidioides posadasii RMSCC 3488 TaxID=454284 RepID=A0A0J6HZQ4_COCPO|nr:hypothetical protein CPAG_00824 [Coccidioides posadasii RMSCC 3488]
MASTTELTQSDDHPPHLDPSELGTKQYWESYYERSLEHLSSKQRGSRTAGDADASSDNNDDDDDDDDDPGTSWFTEHNAPEKVLRFLTAEGFPLAPCNTSGREQPRILDLGTGNGSMLTLLREEGGFLGDMVGVDYSERSVELARRLAGGDGGGQGRRIRFEVWDILAAGEGDDDDNDGSGGGNNGLDGLEWFPAAEGGFDIVLDKGTFDAVSLSGEEIVEGERKVVRRVCEMYPRVTRRLVKKGGFLVVTSCNWTEDELVRWFTRADGRDGGDALEVWGKVEYPKFRFGGMEGQGVCTVLLSEEERAVRARLTGYLHI